MASVTAQDTPTVSSSPNSAKQKHRMLATCQARAAASGIIAAAVRKPTKATERRAIFSTAPRFTSRSDAHPPIRSPTTPAISGRLANRPINAMSNPRASCRYLGNRSEEHTSELQSLMRISYAVFCLKKKNNHSTITQHMHNKHLTYITQSELLLTRISYTHTQT